MTEQRPERFDPDAGPRGRRPYPDSGRPGGRQDDLEFEPPTEDER